MTLGQSCERLFFTCFALMLLASDRRRYFREQTSRKSSSAASYAFDVTVAFTTYILQVNMFRIIFRMKPKSRELATMPRLDNNAWEKRRCYFGR